MVDEIFSKINKEYRQYKLHQWLLKNRSKETKLIHNHPVPVNFWWRVPITYLARFMHSLRGNERKSRAYDRKKKRERLRRGRIRLPRPNLEVNSDYRWGKKPASWLRAGEWSERARILWGDHFHIDRGWRLISISLQSPVLTSMLECLSSKKIGSVIIYSAVVTDFWV